MAHPQGCVAEAVMVGSRGRGCGSAMKTSLIALSLLTLLIPVASASEPIPVGSCVGMDKCSGGAEACVGAFHWVPFCVDACDGCVAFEPAEQAPLVDVCVEGQTDASCYGGNTVCVTFSRQVPQCVDLCTECIGPIAPIGPSLVHVCVEGVTEPTCYGFHSVCVEVSRMVPQCADLDEAQPRCLDYYFDLEAGPVYYRQPNSCTREVYVDGERVL